MEIKEKDAALNIQTVLNLVCNHYQMNEKDLLSKTRKQEIKEARQIFQYFAYRFTPFTQEVVGGYKADYNHSTVIHSIKTVNNLRDTERIYKSNFTKLEKELIVQNYLAANGSTTMSSGFIEFVNDLDVNYEIIN